MRRTGTQRIVALATAVVGLLTLAGGLAAPPAGAAGLALTATTATTNLTPGATVGVKVTGASARQVLRYGVCATGSPCAPSTAVTANASGVATFSLEVTGTATYVEAGTTHVKACRPDRCVVAVQPNGQPGARKTLPLRFQGERVTMTVQGAQSLSDRQNVYVTGRVRGAQGRTVRAIETKPSCGTTCVATIGEGTVRSDGTFEIIVQVRRTLPGGATAAAGSCSPTNATAIGLCQIEVSVVGDPSHGIGSQLIRFLDPGVTVTATPRSDLVDKQAVKLTGTNAALAGRQVRIRQYACDVTDPFNPVCGYGPTIAPTLDAQGRLNATIPVRRFVGAEDCARDRYPSPDCYLEVMVLTSGGSYDTRTEITRTTIFFRPV